MSKILCPDGVERTTEEVLNSDFEHYPPVVLKALLAGRNKKKNALKIDQSEQRYRAPGLKLV